MADAVALSGVRTRYLEIALELILEALLSGQPVLEQSRSALFSLAGGIIRLTAGLLPHAQKENTREDEAWKER